MGWEGSTCRARHLSFSKAYRLPPSCSICVQRAKCPPFPAIKRVPISENGGGKKGARASLSLKREFEFKNIIIIITIIITVVAVAVVVTAAAVAIVIMNFALLSH